MALEEWSDLEAYALSELLLTEKLPRDEAGLLQVLAQKLSAANTARWRVACYDEASKTLFIQASPLVQEQLAEKLRELAK